MEDEFSSLTREEREVAAYAYARRTKRPQLESTLNPISNGLVFHAKKSRQKVVVNNIVEGGSAEFYYGTPTDDRMDFCDFHNFESEQWKEFKETYAGRHLWNKTLFRENVYRTIGAVAAIVRRCHYDKFRNGEVRTLKNVIASKFDQRTFAGNFGNDICLARGTAFLIAKDLLLTASHNLRDENGEINSSEFVYLFDFYLVDRETKISSANVAAYAGQVVMVGEGLNDDWAVVRLGAEFPGGNGVPLASREVLRLSSDKRHPRWRQGCYSAGFSLGVPMKLSLVGHHVHKLLDDRFAVNLDMFHGNSGSPVLNIRTNEVIGLFVAGYPDLVLLADGRVGLREYRYGDIAKGRGGEHCQLIGKIFPKIEHLLDQQS